MKEAPIRLTVAFLCLLVVTVVWTPNRSPDSDRFEAQADGLIMGQGFSSKGLPETALPPGYPLFLAAVSLVTRDEGVVRLVQAALAVLSCDLLFLAFANRGRRFAFLAAAALAIHPWKARLVSNVLSETLGVFLCACLVFLLSRIVKGERGAMSATALGIVSMALALVTPAALVLTFSISAVVLIFALRRWWERAVLVVGTLLLFVPWQLHCVRALGNPCWTFYSIGTYAPTGFGRWVRTWLLRERELYVLWDTKFFATLPTRAFDSEEQRRLLQETYLEGSQQQSDPAFGRAADQRLKEHPVRCRVLCPMIRAANLWVDMPQLKHIQMEYVGRLVPWSVRGNDVSLDRRRIVKRVIKAWVSTAAWVFYISYPAFFLALSARALRLRDPIGIAIIAGVVAYIAAAAYTGMMESRRNYPFFPALLYLGGLPSGLTLRRRS